MSKDSRRSFLKNTAFLAVGAGLGPTTKLIDDSTKVEDLSCEPTTLDYYGQGPFYTSGPPILGDDNNLAATNEQGERIIITGRVRNLDCSQFLPDTIIDIWHADDAGTYDNDGYNLRGITKSNAQGFYTFETIKPGKYLNGSKYRPSHIHFKITPPDFPELITQLYFQGDTSIPEDAAASLDSGTFDASSRIIALNTNANGVLEGNWDIVVDGLGVVGTNDIHTDKGILYSVQPNPFVDSVDIHYSIYSRANVGLLVFDNKGQQVATLESQSMPAGKYHSTWQPDAATPAGYYYVILKVNDLQIHYLKVLKQ